MGEWTEGGRKGEINRVMDGWLGEGVNMNRWVGRWMIG